MSQIKLQIKYGVDVLSSFSAQDLKDKFLYGLPDEFNGSTLPEDTINFYIQSAKQQLESYLGLKLERQLISERLDFIVDDWVNWGFIKTTYPVQEAVSIEGYLGTNKIINYPKDWISQKETTDGRTYSRQLRLVPVGSTMTYESATALYFGSVWTPQIAWWRMNRNIPNYWKINYITGFPNDVIPADILQAIGMIAVIPILGIISDKFSGTNGVGFGVNSKSISIDGLSQSISSFANGQNSVFGARMKQYGDQLFGTNGKQGLLEVLKESYSAIMWTTC